MEVTSGIAVEVSEPSQVSEARRRAMAVAGSVGLGEDGQARVALIVTELGTNLLKHAGGGEVFVGPAGGGTAGVQMIALDKGRGIADVAESLRDGYSTAGSPGSGLGAIRRASSSFDLYSVPARGTVLAATVCDGGDGRPAVGGVSVPAPGEVECGDGWAIWNAGQLTSLFVCDGLGHGSGAADATRAAVAAFRRHAERPAAEVIRLVYDALKHTRGAAVALAELDSREGRLVFCGLGNIAGSIIRPDGEIQRMVSHNGIAGHTMRRLNSFAYAWSTDSLVIVHTDGLGSSWMLSRYAGLQSRRPDVIAGVLYRDFRRGRDDATVVVARNAAGRPAAA